MTDPTPDPAAAQLAELIEQLKQLNKHLRNYLSWKGISADNYERVREIAERQGWKAP